MLTVDYYAVDMEVWTHFVNRAMYQEFW